MRSVLFVRLLLVVAVTSCVCACRDKQLDLQRATLVRQLTQEQAALDAHDSACKTLSDAPVAVPQEILRREAELEAKPQRSVADIQEQIVLSRMKIDLGSKNIAAIDTCIVERPPLAARVMETKAKIADIDQIQPPAG